MIPIPAAALRTLLEPKDETEVRQQALSHDYASADLVTSAFTMASVLLFQGAGAARVSFPDGGGTAYERWIEDAARQRAYLGHILTGWVTTRRHDLDLFPVFLYNRDFAQARRALSTILTFEPAPPPYLYLLLLNLFRQELGLSHDAMASLDRASFDATAQHVRALLSGDRVDRWLHRKAQPLRFYGGATNTVLGLYDATFADPAAGLEHFHRDAEARYDLGGGFNTSEIERLLGCTFTSADVVTPRMADYDPELVLHVVEGDGTHRVATSAERDAHRTRQERVAHLPLDVLRAGLPRDARSYAIVSTGFLTSTVRPGEHQPDWTAAGNEGVGHLGLSLHALARVLELVRDGKSVDLFTVQRASSRVYKYKTVLAQWRAGRLARLVTTDDRISPTRWTREALAEVRRRIDPSGEHFARHVP